MPTEDPKVHCVIRRPADLTSEQIVRLLELTIGPRSDLSGIAYAMEVRPDDDVFHVALALDSESHIVGWAATEYYRGVIILGTFVDRKWRGQGIGTRLAVLVDQISRQAPIVATDRDVDFYRKVFPGRELSMVPRPQPITISMCGPSKGKCKCECSTGGPCDHDWDGPEETTEHSSSATCSKCGMSAMSHSMWVGP